MISIWSVFSTGALVGLTLLALLGIAIVFDRDDETAGWEVNCIAVTLMISGLIWIETTVGVPEFNETLPIVTSFAAAYIIENQVAATLAEKGHPESRAALAGLFLAVVWTVVIALDIWVSYIPFWPVLPAEADLLVNLFLCVVWLYTF
ncbi:hypothetical protein ACFR97_00260 [Haloplanus litoreus]|uniref:Uncharacterized protein n=1 Tax=Haloplanus litoreus TaxID=767515 RepID=A0ABD5ZWV0_9EURY